MKPTLAVAALATATALAITGCDRLVGDHETPVPVQGSDVNPQELKPGLWTTMPPQSVDGCRWMVFRDGYPIVRGEAHDTIPVYVWLPPTDDTADYGLTTVGCGTWERVTA